MAQRKTNENNQPLCSDFINAVQETLQQQFPGHLRLSTSRKTTNLGREGKLLGERTQI